MERIGFGGGCHWCTEAVFQSIKGVVKVEQGWVSSFGDHSSYSEGVIVHFDSEIVSMEKLINIHLNTHSSKSNHRMREKYRSAIYVFDKEQEIRAKDFLIQFGQSCVTEVMAFKAFKPNEQKYLNYYQKHKLSPFSLRHIENKLSKVKDMYPKDVKG
ncbi:MAG: peptide methionine sulfoxide reductase [Halobacteriovoraceae bacterium]|nr:peptide methionine sulfoxide reductase [Halobacteriovoraceae bacterium]|tara:strand:- start:106874 stop:107344 length:471 start_codon:yes stop_codon:yes gene_type:complete